MNAIIQLINTMYVYPSIFRVNLITGITPTCYIRVHVLYGCKNIPSCNHFLTNTIGHSIKIPVIPTCNGGRSIHNVSYIAGYCQSFLEPRQGGRGHSAILYCRNGTRCFCKSYNYFFLTI